MLPESFVKRGLERAKTLYLFGQRADGLTRDELLAGLAEVAHSAEVQRESSKHTTDFLFDLIKARRA
jgi:hypothetical protein